MAISLEPINVGVENQSTGSDSLFVAFTKTQNNFNTLANTASPYNTFNGGTGILTETFPGNGTVSITNSGVISIIAGTGITTSSSNGNITLSVSGSANGTVVAGVTNVGISSNTLSVSNSPIISNGIMSVDLPTIDTVEPGYYVAPSVVIDAFGRITSISNTESSGTVTSIAVAPGEGIGVEGGPITSSGTITITNTGVTRLNAGTGITLSGHSGEITVSASNPVSGTVTSIEVTSSTLVVTGSPITSTGTINIELPESDTMTGNFTAGNITSSANLVALGNANIVGTFKVSGATTLSGALSVTANANITGNLSVSANANITGNLSVTANASSNNFSASRFLTVGNSTQGRITSFDVNVSNAMIVANTGALLLNTVSDNSKFVALQAPSSISGSYIAWSLPNAEGTANSFMMTNGSGQLSFRQPASSVAPTANNSAGFAGQIAYDSTHIYVCIATNTWKRADLATW